MKKIYIITILTVLSNYLYCQTPTWNWANSINTGQNEIVTDVAVDPLSGNVYAVGTWETNLSSIFPAGALPSEDFSSLYGGNNDGFVAKYDNLGNLIWSFKIGCNREDYVNAICVDPAGDIYITGSFEDNTAQFTGTGALTGTVSLTNNDNDFDVFVAKYNSNGQLLWVKQGIGEISRDVSGINLSAYANGIFVTGYYNDSIDFGAFKIPDHGLWNQAFLVKYDENGNEQWSAHGASNNHDNNSASYFNGVTTDGINVYVSGNFKGSDFDLYDNTNTVVGNVSNSQDGRQEIVIASFTVDGVFNWLQVIGGDQDDEDKSIIVDNNNIYATGGIDDNSNFPGYFGNPVNSSGNMDIFISSHSKIDGSTSWVNVISCTDGGDEMGTSITIDTHTNILISGYFRDNLNFSGNIISSVGGEDGFIASFANNGVFYWAKNIGSGGNDKGLGISSNTTDKVYISGNYRDLANLDGIILPNDGGDNGFIAQIDPCVDAVGGDATTTDSILCLGENTTISLVGSQGSIQWQSSPNGLNTWSDIIGATNSNLIVSPVSNTDYRAVLTPISCNNDTSDILTIVVNPNPTATISGTASLCSGSSTPIDIVLTGAIPFNFTYTDGTTSTNIIGHGTNNYSNNVSPTDTTNYTIISVTDNNGCSNTGSGNALISVIPQVTITTQPTNKNLCPGDNTSFSVTASGTGLSYQWEKNGAPIVGAISSTYTINNIDAGDAAKYACIVSSLCGGPLTSDTATLSLYIPTNISSHPVDDYLCTGESLNLSVTAMGSNINYQWRKDGIALFEGGNINGSNTDILIITNVTSANAGIYTCDVVGSCGTKISNPAIVQIDAPIVITQQPTSSQACPGDNISFTTTATGTNLTYQWQKNSGDIVGETSQSLIINNVVTGDAGNFMCIVSSPCGDTINSNTVILTVNTSTQLISNPTDATECVGDNISFEVTANGTNLSYQWMKDGLPLLDTASISSSTTNQLIITGLDTNYAGQYLCEVTGACGTLNSNPANLTVDDNISITTQPINKSSCVGNNVNFSLVATGSNLSYQWQKNGINITGETNASLALNSVTIADAGNYHCIITNSCGATLNSNTVSLSILNTVSVITQPTDTFECIGNDMNFTISATGSGLSYQWYKDGHTLSNGADTTGAISNNLYITNLNLSARGTYYCRITGTCNSIDSDPAELVVDDNITITAQPANIQACETDNISFNLIATGSNLTYQWQKNTVNIPGETNNILTLSNITVADAGNYRCVISNNCNDTLISQPASLSLFSNTSITTQPLDTSICLGDNTSFSVIASGSNLLYQWRKDGGDLSDIGNINGSETPVLAITGLINGDDGVYSCEVSGSCGTINSNPATLILKDSTKILTHPTNKTVCPGNNVNFNVSATGSNLSYVWQKDGAATGITTSGFTISNVSAADAGVYRCIVSGDCGSLISNAASLTVNQNVSIVTQPVHDTICENDAVNFSISATGTGLNYQWRRNGIDVSDSDSISGSSTNNLNIDPTIQVNAGVYTCEITGTCNTQNSNPASLIVYENTSISAHPQNLTACSGENANFSVTASGNNISYQWQLDGANILGETNSGLVLTNVTDADEGIYRCIVSGDCNTLISNGASLVVDNTVSITSQPPASHSLCEGDNLNLNVAATGTNIYYQWQRNGSDIINGGDISGAKSDNLIISNIDETNDGVYTCIVTGSCGSETSILSDVTVYPTTIITQQPTEYTILESGTATFSITAEGDNLTYQWQKDGSNLSDAGIITGSSTPTLTLTGVAESDEGAYRCIVTGTCNTSNSNPANLIVNQTSAITTQPASLSRCEGESANFSITTSGGTTIKWQLDGVNLNDNSNISGSSTINLSIDSVNASDAGAYTCIVDGEISAPAILTVNLITTINSHPQSYAKCIGDFNIFSVSAIGTSLSYQWEKDGVPLGPNLSSLSIPTLALGDAGNYRCIVSGVCGTANSNSANLTIYDSTLITLQPVGNTICEGQSYTFSITANGDNLDYQWEKNGVNLSDTLNISGSNTANLNITSATTSNNGTYTCEIIGNCGSEISNMALLTVKPLTTITSHPTDISGCDGDNINFSVIASGSIVSYQWQKDGVDLNDVGIISGSSTSLLTLTGISPVDAGSYRCVVTGDCNTISSNPAILDSYNNTLITSQPADNTVCENDPIALSVTASGNNLNYQWLKDGATLLDTANYSGSNTSTLQINITNNSNSGIYTCNVTGVCGNENSSSANLTVDINTTITTHPQNTTKCEGDIAILTINAIGKNLSYLWEKDGGPLIDGGNIVGSSSNTLSLSNLSLTDAGAYRCIVSGDCGVVNSNAASLTINAYPGAAGAIIGTNTVCQGDSSVFFEVAAISNADYYIWNLPVGASIVSGDSTRIIEVAFSINELGGNITVRGINSCGFGTISPALNVTANPIPVALAGADQNLCFDNTTLAAAHPGTAIGTWSVFAGPANVQNVNFNTSTITNLRQGSNTLIWTVSENGCSSSDTIIITNNQVYVEAGTNVTICTSDITLEGNTVPVGATGNWSVVSGTANFAVGNDPTTVASGFTNGINELKWTITNAGCLSYDTVFIDNQRPSTSQAGIDQAICKDSTILTGIIPVVGSGNWTVIAGSATFNDPSVANTKVTNLGQGDNILRWTISNGICSSIDEATITNNIVTVNAGVDQLLCDRTSNLAADPPITGFGNWSVAQGSAAFVNNNLFNTKVTNLASGDNLLVWNINNNGCISRDTVLLTNDSPTTADAGIDQMVLTDFTTLQANIPSIGSGVWSLISGSAVIVNDTLYNTNITSLGLGANTFRWTITNNSCISNDDVIITNGITEPAEAGPDQTICFDSTSLNAKEPIHGFGEWSVIQGAATFNNNSDNKTIVTDLAKGDNILRWTVWFNGYTYDDVVITNDAPSTANAGIDQVLCLDSAILAANDPLVGTGLWSVTGGAGQFEYDTLYNTKITNLAKGDNILKWTITNKSCTSSDQVIVRNDLPTIADAGVDQVTCTGSAKLTPNTPTVGIGEWSVLSGSGSFTGNDVSSLASDTSILRWTITNYACSSFDDVMVVNNEPSDALAGADKTICYDSLNLSASLPIIGTGIWTIQNGSAIIADPNIPNTKITNISQGTNVFRWTVSYNGCSKFDEVIINNALITSINGPDQVLCDNSIVLEANNPEAGIGTWSVIGGSGSTTFEDPNQPDTRVNNLEQGINILRWTIVNDICTSSSDVIITNDLPAASFAGPDQNLCTDNTTFEANIPIIGTGQWSILSGSATITDINNATSTVTNLTNGINTFRWTTTNNSCILTDEVVINNNSITASNAGSDQVICVDSTTLYGNNPPYGTGQWSVVAGSATFADNNLYNTKITSLGTGQNTLRWLITNENCSSSDDVLITNNSPSKAIAGADQTICGDSTVMAANIPIIGTGTWTLMSGAAIFNNNNNYNTKVTNLSPGPNTLRWAITNNGCASYDDVIITNDLPYIADAGTNMEVCGSDAVLYANDPVSGIGQWEIISGSGTFDDPTKYNTTISDLGFGINTLRWTITYDACSTSDEIQIANNQIDLYAGIDQTIGQSSTLLAATNPSTGSGTWQVIGGSGTFTSPTNPITEVTNLGGGLNTFRWAVDINGCISYDDVLVTYNIPPLASFVINKDQGCPPLNVYFVNNSLDGLSFTWDFGDGTTSQDVTVQHSYAEPGIYNASLTIIGNNGETVVKDTSIIVYNQPEASFLVINQEVYIPEEEAFFTSTSSYTETYQWEFGDGNSSVLENPNHIYETEGIYDVTLHVWSDKNCYDSITIPNAVEVYESGGIIFPNAFTPNLSGSSNGVYDSNDFNNDVFYPIGDGVQEYKLQIFNRWGILVFESTNMSIGWDGYYKGQLLDEGVYVWKVTGKYNNGRELKKMGTVLLVR